MDKMECAVERWKGKGSKEFTHCGKRWNWRLYSEEQADMSKLCWGPGPELVTGAMSGSRVLLQLGGLCRCLCPKLPLKAKWMSVVWAATRDHVIAKGLSTH